MDPSFTSPGRQDPRVLSDEALEHVVGGAGPVSPGMLRALLRGAPRPGTEAGAGTGAVDPAPAG